MYHPKHFQQWKRQRRLKKLHFVFVMIVLGVIVFAMIRTVLHSDYISLSQQTRFSDQNSEPFSALLQRNDPTFAVPSDELQQHQLSSTHKVTGHQNLSKIFSLYGLDPQDLLAIIRTNQQATYLSPGQVLEWQQTPDGQLQSLTIHRNARLSSQFIRCSKAQSVFQFVPKRVEGDIKTFVKQGKIKQSFYQTARTMGLTLGQMQEIATALYWQLDVTKQAKFGDKIMVQLSSYFIANKQIETGEVMAIWYQQGKQNYQIARASNGELYFVDGSSIGKRLDRYPVKSHFRISSGFDPHRLNPVTHLYAPHYGTDIAIPIGTPVYATGDGVVIKVGHHPLAGNYLVIKNGRTYSTRFLHLSQILVKVGQVVSRNEKIALSGNTGRSTGPHLHYELRKNDQPIDAMSAPLPQGDIIPVRLKSEFTTTSQEKMQKIRDLF